MRRSATFKTQKLKLKLVIRHYESIQVVGITVVFVGACVTVHTGLRLDKRVAARGFTVARYGGWNRRVLVVVVVDRRRWPVERPATDRRVVLFIG